MNHTNTFRFVLVGTGIISDAYVAAIQELPNVELVGIVSRSGKRPSSLAQKQEIPVASSLEEFPVPYDGIILATPNGCHHYDAIAAARLGKHVVCEKVLDISLEACDRMISACQENGVQLGVSYQRRLSPTNRRLKRLLEEGALGKVIAVELEAKFFRGQDYYDSSSYRGTKSIDGGGVLMQQAAHDLDLLIWFFGLPQKVSSVYGTFLHTMESEDHGAAIMQFESGMIGTLIASTCCRPQQPAKLTIHSDRGTLVLSGDRIASLEMEGLDISEIESVKVEDFASGHQGILENFVGAIALGRSPLICGKEARKSVELILQIYNSHI